MKVARVFGHGEVEVTMRTPIVIAAALLVSCGKKTESEPTVVEPPGPEVEEVLAPGSQPLHRLNRVEYENTLVDLLATTTNPARLFPADEVTYGFDNIAEGLSISPTHVEQYERAVDEALDELFGRHLEATERYGLQGEGPGVSYSGVGEPIDDWGYRLQSGSIDGSLAVAYDGWFELNLRASGNPLEGNPIASIQVDGTEIAEFEILPASSGQDMYSVGTELSDGFHTFSIVMTNPYNNIDKEKRGITVDWLEIQGPMDPQTGPSDHYRDVVLCEPVDLGEAACAELVFEDFLLLAWRRPPSAEDLAWVNGLYEASIDAGISWSESVQYGLKGILMAPEFIYRLEADPAPGEVRDLNAFEVATRMSYFLWSSTPDRELLDAAQSGAIPGIEGLQEQIDRMLTDERSRALVDNLGGQWFDIRQVEDIHPDAETYPDFDEGLPESMQAELLWMAEGFFQGEEDFYSLLTRQESFIDARLAQHYVLPEPSGGAEVMSLAGTGRQGLLSTAGWLSVQSHADRPSAVRRGRWILDSLLCSPPPPPPPDVESSFDPQPSEGSIREQEESLRGQDACAACHDNMDPLGWALHDYDATGALRTVDELGYPIDTNTTMMGVDLSNVEDIVNWVVADPRLPRCVVEKTFTYAVGRAPTVEDQPFIDSITETFVAGGLTFPALAEGIVTNPAFLQRYRAMDVEESP